MGIPAVFNAPPVMPTFHPTTSGGPTTRVGRQGSGIPLQTPQSSLEKDSSGNVAHQQSSGGFTDHSSAGTGSQSSSPAFVARGYLFPAGLNRKERRRICFTSDFDPADYPSAVFVGTKEADGPREADQEAELRKKVTPENSMEGMS